MEECSTTHKQHRRGTGTLRQNFSAPAIPNPRQEFLRHSHEMLQALCGLVERYATVVDVEKHANTLPKPPSTEEYQRIHVWGRVLEQDGNALVRSAKLEAFA